MVIINKVEILIVKAEIFSQELNNRKVKLNYILIKFHVFYERFEFVNKAYYVFKIKFSYFGEQSF